MRSVIAILLLATASTSALADDRASCDKGDKKACARIGRLLNGAALDKELGADKAKPLAAKFDGAWAHLFK